VGQTLRVEPEKVVILRHDNASGRSCELKLRYISRSAQAGIDGGSHVNAPPPEASRDVG
jgi:hypothetical protein